MSLINCLKKVLRDEVLIGAEARNDTQIIELAESGVMRVAIEIPSHINVLAIRMGGNSPINHLGCIRDAACRKVCDYLFVSQSETECHIAFIELKASLTNERKAREQLFRSLPIWDYLFSVCKTACEMKYPTPSIKYFLITKKGSERMDKQPTRAVRRPLGNQIRHKGIHIHTFTGIVEFPMSRFTT